MNTWVIVSWVFVAILTGINIFIFLKLKQASEQVMKMAFPNARGMGDAMAQMQRLMGGGMPGANPGMGGANMEQQMKAAMSMLQQMSKNQGKRR